MGAISKRKLLINIYAIGAVVKIREHSYKYELENNYSIRFIVDMLTDNILLIPSELEICLSGRSDSSNRLAFLFDKYCSEYEIDWTTKFLVHLGTKKLC